MLLHLMKQLMTEVLLHQMKQVVTEVLHQMRKLVSKIMLCHN
jgi:hypothetical protein